MVDCSSSMPCRCSAIGCGCDVPTTVQPRRSAICCRPTRCPPGGRAPPAAGRCCRADDATGRADGGCTNRARMARIATRPRRRDAMTALLTDLYQLTMLQAYLDEDMQQEATFELFVRKLPAQRNFLVAAGLEQALQFLETLAFSDDEIAWIE